VQRPLDPIHPMSDEEFRLLRNLINDHCGILFEDSNKFLVERRLSPRLEALGLDDFTAYYRHLRYAPDRRSEYEEIIERLTTNETYFFRERYQLDAFQFEILPRLAISGAPTKRLRIWSAGCATGEEAYTIAMIVLETHLFRDWDVRVFGSDISRKVLAAARKGQYGRSSFRQTEEAMLRRYFDPVDGRYQVRPEVRALVSFGQLNMLDDLGHALVGDMDVIFCRNVLIYFDQESRRRVVNLFHRKLVRGGFLLLGHTESLLNLSTAFELLHLENDMVYRRP
jgi:chemotaxis protein methyltransferase CheR